MELDPDGPPEKEKLVLKRSILGPGTVMLLDKVQIFQQTRSVIYRGERLLHALNTEIALLDIRLSLNGSRPKHWSLINVGCQVLVR